MKHLLLLSAFVVSLVRAGDQPLRVVTLNTVLTEVAREVGGDQVVVNGLVKPDVDPHSFDPSASDIRKLAEADVVLASGLNLDSFLDRIAVNTGGKARVVKIGDALPSVLSMVDGRDHAHAPKGDVNAEQDPHWWHSIDNVLFASELVCAEYARLRPSSAAEFVRNTQAYRRRLLALKTEMTREIDTLPPAKRHLVTSHEAFGYFARDYGFTVHAISGLSTDSEPDARHLATLIDLIRREHIKAVFAESSVNSKLIANLVRETGVHLGGTLYADGLGVAGGDAATYEAMVRHNVRTVVESLR